MNKLKDALKQADAHFANIDGLKSLIHESMTKNIYHSAIMISCYSDRNNVNAQFVINKDSYAHDKIKKFILDLIQDEHDLLRPITDKLHAIEKLI